MRLYRSRLLILAAAAFFIPHLVASITYNVVTLSSLPGYAQPQSLNDNLEIAGVANPSLDDVTLLPFTAAGPSYTYNQGTSPTGLRTVEIVSLNDSGNIAGYGVTTTTDFDQAFIGSTVLPFPAGFTGSVGTQFNNAGQLAGFLISNGPAFANHAGIMTASSSAELSTANSLFNGINSAAAPVAVGQAGAVGSLQLIYGNASSVTTVSVAGTGFTEMLGSGINNQGNICGVGTDTGSSDQQAFVYNTTTKATTIIPIVSGFDVAELGPQCISGGNVVVGTVNSTLGVNEAFAWDATDGTQLLSALVGPGWTFTEAVAINANGDILVRGTNGVFTGYELLEPVPEPSMFLPLGIPLLSLGISLRRRA